MAKYKGWNDDQITEALKNRKKTEGQIAIVSELFNYLFLQWKATQQRQKNAPEADKYKKQKETTFDRLHKESEQKRLDRERAAKDKEMKELQEIDELAYKNIKVRNPRTVE